MGTCAKISQQDIRSTMIRDELSFGIPDDSAKLTRTDLINRYKVC